MTRDSASLSPRLPRPFRPVSPSRSRLIPWGRRQAVSRLRFGRHASQENATILVLPSWIVGARTKPIARPNKAKWFSRTKPMMRDQTKPTVRDQTKPISLRSVMGKEFAADPALPRPLGPIGRRSGDGTKPIAYATDDPGNSSDHDQPRSTSPISASAPIGKTKPIRRPNEANRDGRGDREARPRRPRLQDERSETTAAQWPRNEPNSGRIALPIHHFGRAIRAQRGPQRPSRPPSGPRHGGNSPWHCRKPARSLQLAIRNSIGTITVRPHVRRHPAPPVGRLRPLQGPGQADRGQHAGGPAGGPHRPAGGRRQLRRRPGVHGARDREGRRPGTDQERPPRAADRQDRPRRAGRADGPGRPVDPVREDRADGHHALRPPGLGQDDHLRQARPAADRPRAQAAARRRRPPAPGGHRAAEGHRPAARRPGPRRGPATADPVKVCRRGVVEARSAAATRSSSTPPAGCTSTTS